MPAADDPSASEGYDRIAADFDRERRPKAWERPFFEALAAALSPGASVLDCGCGSGHLGIARIVERGCGIVGLDGSAEMLALFRRRYPGVATVHADMRTFEPTQRFDAVIAWDSVFHLSQADQSAMIPRFASWLRPDGRLLFTSGPSSSVVQGEMFGVPFSYASFAEEEYRAMLNEAGFADIVSTFDEPGAAIHKVWTARRAA